MKSKRRKKKAIEKNRCYLCVVEIRYVHMPDADERLARATDILLSSATRDAAASRESINAKKRKATGRLGRRTAAI